MGVLDPPLNPAKYEDEIALSVSTVDVLIGLPIATYDMTYPAIAVPPSTFPVNIDWSLHVQTTVAGAGYLGSCLVETTTGGKKVAKWAGRGSTFLFGLVSYIQDSFEGSLRVPPSATWRYYRLGTALYRDTGSTLTAAVMPYSVNTGLENAGARVSYLRAVKG